MSAPRKQENFIINLACNVVVPGVLLSKGDDWLPKILPAALLNAEGKVNPEALLIAALAFPVTYFVYDYIRRRVANPISILGFVGTLVSGVIGLMKVDPFWFAVKEAAFPVVIGTVLYLTQWIKRPLVKSFVFNDMVLDTEKIEATAKEKNAGSRIDALFAHATYLLAPAFFLSAIAHFFLARYLVTAHPETAATLFNEQLGKFNLIAWPAIILPSFGYLVWVMMRFMKRLPDVVGLPEDELYRSAK